MSRKELTPMQARRAVIRAQRLAELEEKARHARANGGPRWELRTGDCIAGMARIEPGTVRLIFADPPYNIGVDYGPHHDDRMDPNAYLGWSVKWVVAAKRLLSPDGSMWVLINDEWADEFGCLLRYVGLHRRAWIKWYESFGVNNTGNFNRCSRHLFYMVRDPDRFVWHENAVTRPSDRQLKYRDKRADPGGKIWDNVWGINPPIPRLCGTTKERIPGFPTQLPLALLRPIIGCASDPGDRVLDPFSGSATTGHAAIELGRNYIGLEKSKEFNRLARMRLKVAGASNAD